MTPNPGSDEARDEGCLCAVLDNNHGRFPPFDPDGWWITIGCPVHSPVGNQVVDTKRPKADAPSVWDEVV